VSRQDTIIQEVRRLHTVIGNLLEELDKEEETPAPRKRRNLKEKRVMDFAKAYGTGKITKPKVR
jgi:hypothetical protein